MGFKVRDITVRLTARNKWPARSTTVLPFGTMLRDMLQFERQLRNLAATAAQSAKGLAGLKIAWAARSSYTARYLEAVPRMVERRE